MENNAKIDNLELIATNFGYDADLNPLISEYSARLFIRKCGARGSLLELGPAEGIASRIFVSEYENITVVEGAKVFCDELKKRYPNITVVHSLIEDFKPTQKYDNIILGHVLEHVDDPVEVLTLCRSWITPEKGRVFATVPNCNSIHRQIGVLLEMQTSTNQLNDRDKMIGHKRVYGWNELRNDFISSGLSILEEGGYFLKPLTNGQLGKVCDKKILDAMMTLGEQYPEIAANIYILAAYSVI